MCGQSSSHKLPEGVATMVQTVTKGMHSAQVGNSDTWTMQSALLGNGNCLCGSLNGEATVTLGGDDRRQSTLQIVESKQRISA